MKEYSQGIEMTSGVIINPADKRGIFDLIFRLW